MISDLTYNIVRTLRKKNSALLETSFHGKEPVRSKQNISFHVQTAVSARAVCSKLLDFIFHLLMTFEI